MLQKSVLWLLILVMLVKTSVLPCAAMSEPQPIMMSTATSVQLLPDSAHQYCADYAVEMADAVGEHAASLADTEHSQTGKHYCYSCHSCGAAVAMMIASEFWRTSLFTEQSPDFRRPKPPLVWLALAERPPKPSKQA